MSKFRGLMTIGVSKVNGVYASAGAAGGCSILSFLPLLTEWLKFGSAAASMAASALAFYLAYRKRRSEKAKR